MKVIKGFVTISQFINNTPGILSPVGELSSLSMTYSKEKGEYQLPEVPGYKLITFQSQDTVTGDLESVNDIQVRQVLDLVRECILYANGHIRPYDTLDFKNTLLANLYNRISDLNIGPFVDNGSIAAPSWVSWNSLEDNQPFVKIWLADAAFANEYDNYEIVVVPPLVPVDTFFNGYATVTTKLKAITTAMLGDSIQAARNEHPETYLRIFNFDYINPLNSAQRVSTNWAVLIYGKQGDYIDAIKDVIIEYVLANSTRTREQWEVILPDIFKRTEFVLVPRWDKISIPNLTNLSSLYSSIINISEAITFAKDNISFYDDSFIETNTEILPFDYKAITMLAINGMDNVTEKVELSDIFPDYVPIASTNIDFARMQTKTQNWILLLEKLLHTAEKINEFDSVPANMRKVKRDNVLFVTAMFDNVNYLMAVKSNSFYNS